VFLADYQQGKAYVPPTSLRERHTRRAQSVTLADLLDKVSSRE
jgi:hypothetical protein